MATGGIPLLPPIQGLNLQGVVVHRSLEDTRKIIHLCDSNPQNKWVILGTGVLGTELAEAVVERGIQVEMFSKDAILVPKMLDSRASTLLTELFSIKSIPIHFNLGVTEILDDGSGKVSGIITESGEQIACQVCRYPYWYKKEY